MTELDGADVPFYTVRQIMLDAVTARTGRLSTTAVHSLQRIPDSPELLLAVLDSSDNASAAAAALRERGLPCEPVPDADGSLADGVRLLIDSGPRRAVPPRRPEPTAVGPHANAKQQQCAVDGCAAVHDSGTAAGPWHVLRHGLSGWLCPLHGTPVRSGSHSNRPDRSCSCGYDFAANSPRARTAAFLAHLVAVTPAAVVLARPARLELDPGVAELIDAADAPNTNRAYESRWRSFVEYCAGLHVEVPVNPLSGLTEMRREDRIVLFSNFAAALLNGTAAASGRPLKAATVGQYLETVRARLIAANPTINPDEFDPATKAIAGRRRLVAKNPHADEAELALIRIRRAPVYTTAQEKAALAGLDRATLVGALDAAVITMLDNLGSRESEVANLAVPDIEFAHGQGMKVTIRASKTDPKAIGRTVFVPYRRDEELCAVLAVQHWMRMRAAAGQPSGTGPLFLPVDRHGNLGLAAAGRRTDSGRIADDYPEKAMARAFAHIGVEVTGHSGRRSYITRQVRAGVELRLICQHTGHRYGSREFEAYVEAARDFAGAAPALE